jgi:hypothetical protein
MKPIDFESMQGLQGFYHPEGQPAMTLMDRARSSAGPLTPVTSIVGFVPVFFDFFNEGGTGNLLPGRPTSQTVTIPNPGGNPFFVMLRGFNGAFVTDGGVNLTARPLGEFEVNLFVPAVNTVGCRVMLSDDNGDDPVRIQVWGWAILFR